MSSCIVRLCKNRGKNKATKESSKIRMLRFPKRLETQWLRAIGLENKIILQNHHRICSEHFQPGDFLTLSNGLKKLKRNVVPSQYLCNSFRTRLEFKKQTVKLDERTKMKYNLLVTEGDSNQEATLNELVKFPEIQQESDNIQRATEIKQEVDVEEFPGIKQEDVDLEPFCDVKQEIFDFEDFHENNEEVERFSQLNQEILNLENNPKIEEEVVEFERVELRVDSEDESSSGLHHSFPSYKDINNFLTSLKARQQMVQQIHNYSKSPNYDYKQDVRKIEAKVAILRQKLDASRRTSERRRTKILHLKQIIKNVTKKNDWLVLANAKTLELMKMRTNMNTINREKVQL